MTASLVAVALLAMAGAAGLEAEAVGAVPSGEDEAKLQQCLEAVRKAESDARACIGVVADPCLDSSGEASPQGMIACIDREVVLWDRMMSARFGSLMSRIDETVGERVRDVQESWVSYRDKRCALGDVLFAEGALTPVWAADCMLQETGRRAIEIGALLDEVSQQ